MTTRYYARGKRVAETNAGVYGDEWVCTMETPERAKWMAEQLNKAARLNDYVVTIPVTFRLAAFDEADALRRASQCFSVGFPMATEVKEPDDAVRREIASV